jgi:CHASE2 domain-containing sensor protein
MMRFYLLIGIAFIVISFVMFLMGLLKFIPVPIGAALLFASILFTVSMFNSRNQFRGFNR